ncbi:UPF0481 protein At3g47200-like [Benincasa hispida]|uniref:UPF0481 protein At3g47200-like n=1 Tax=Benincasa hispida TaxID=102211 RepID=UPI0018FFC60F|nr:UPF0481 protein At3g47200-like [Benincasa hispida]
MTSKLRTWQKVATEVNQQHCGNIVMSIEKKLKRLSPVTANSNIYQVTKALREMNPKAYAPQLISIGPLHHGTRKDLIANEQYKLHGFMNFLRRMNNNMIESMDHVGFPQTRTLNVLVEKAHCWVKEARNCYATPIKMKEEEFVTMMLVDACFIVEFFILKFDDCHPNCKFVQIQENVDISFYEGIEMDIPDDLIKLENQVPFFLLRSLFDLIPKHNVPLISSFKDDKNYLPHCTLKFGLVRESHEIDLNEEPEHLPTKNKSEKVGSIPPSITELYEAGVTIKKAKNTKYMRDITFKNGVLEIPPLHIYDDFELMLRNMVAFEQFNAANRNKYVTQYVLFLDHLISTEKDVHLLMKAGIIINNIGGCGKEVSDLFNNLGKFVTESSSSHFDPISEALRKHCNRRWNKTRASLKHDYFNTPWAWVSFSAAALVIFLNILQTFFAFVSACC